jgi:glycine cleavage system H protein
MEKQGNLGEIREHRGCMIPPDLYYDIESQVWVRVNEDGTVTLGLTDVGQTRAGRLLHIRVKPEGAHVKKGKPVATLESGKWAGPVPALVEGDILEVNPKVAQDPNFINIDPYGEAWIVKLKPTDLERDLKDLYYGEEAYKAMVDYIEEWDINCMRCI